MQKWIIVFTALTCVKIYMAGTIKGKGHHEVENEFVICIYVGFYCTWLDLMLVFYWRPSSDKRPTINILGLDGRWGVRWGRGSAGLRDMYSWDAIVRLHSNISLGSKNNTDFPHFLRDQMVGWKHRPDQSDLRPSSLCQHCHGWHVSRRDEQDIYLRSSIFKSGST